MMESKIEPFDSKEDREKFKFRKNILEALLYCSISGNKFIFPTIERFIFSEVIKGTLEYVTGKESNFEPKEDRFELVMYNHFQQQLKKGKNPLTPGMEEALLKLLEPSWESDQWSDGEYETELYRLFIGGGLGGICKVIMRSTFSLDQSVINHVKGKVLPSLPKPIKRDVQGIGRLMRGYIEEDLKYIKGRYHW